LVAKLKDGEESNTFRIRISHQQADEENANLESKPERQVTVRKHKVKVDGQDMVIVMVKDISDSQEL
jgi:hypothetical protein